MNNSTENYYTDKTRISNSNIGWFLNKGPAYLHKMLTEDVPEEKSQVLERGTMIHEYILQPQEFQKDYVVWDKSRPTSAQQEKFCQALASSLEIEPNRAILSAYKEAYSTVGKSDDKMLSEGLKIASTLKDYIDFLKSNDRRIMISHWDYKMLEKIKHNIQFHKLADKIIHPYGWNRDYTWDANIAKIEALEGDFTAYHEFHINWEYEFAITNSDDDHIVNIKCKSLLDGVTLDFGNKKAIIYDLKTTQKLWNFEESMNTYDYLRQLAYYAMAVRWYLINECGVTSLEIPDWDFKYYIIGIDTTGTYDIRVFRFTQEDINTRYNTILGALVEIGWHQETGKWDHSRAYYEGDGSESLNI